MEKINLEIKKYFKKYKKLPKFVNYKNKKHRLSHLIYFIDSKWRNIFFKDILKQPLATCNQ